MYTNIQKTDTINIINNTLQDNQETIRSTQKKYILQTVMEQNYFEFHQQYYKHSKGLALGTPASPVLAKTYIQYMEHKQIYLILIEQQIIAYFRYINDISK
jgi:hypothetical protein